MGRGPFFVCFSFPLGQPRREESAGTSSPACERDCGERRDCALWSHPDWSEEAAAEDAPSSTDLIMLQAVWHKASASPSQSFF